MSGLSGAIVAILVLAPGPAMAMQRASGSGDLSPRLAKLAKPAVSSSAKAAQASRLDLPAEGPGSLLRNGNRVLVYVRFGRNAAGGIEALRAAGGKIVDVSRRYQTVTVAAKPGALEGIAAVRNVAGVTEALAPVTAASVCPSGPVISEGVAGLHAGDASGEARDEFGVDGTGVTVGILSDSFDQATEAADGSGPIATTAPEDVASGDLPGLANTCGHVIPVAVLEENKSGVEESTDEGRAMTQIVHDLAPAATLAFASAFNGETSFAKNIKALATAGADVVVDDVFYLEEPYFQDGPVAVAVDEAVGAGVAYFSAAGNDNLADSEGHDIASWETPAFRDAANCPLAVQSLPNAKGTHCMDFHPGAPVDRTFGIRVSPGALLTVDLQWSEPWNGVGTDLDAFLLDSSGSLIAASAEDNVGISQKPVEIVQWANESGSQRTVQLVVNRYAGGAPRLKLGLLQNGSGVTAIEYPRSTGEDVVGPTVFGHSGAASAISVGAVRFNKSSEPEKYSSRGPVRHDFGPVIGTGAAAPLPSAEIISKPDLSATDCGLTTFFAHVMEGGWRFCGTSAAAPHVAGIAALMLDAETAEPAEVRTALQASAAQVGAFGPCAIGAGLIEAVGAIEDLLTPPTFTPPECSPPSPEGSPEEARAPGNWGVETPPTSVPPTAQTPPPGIEPQAEATSPRTFFRLRPRKVVRSPTRTARVAFRFGSNEAGSTFVCRIDGGLFRPCPERLTRRLGLGWHTVYVAARDAEGNSDRTPAHYRFKVKWVG